MPSFAEVASRPDPKTPLGVAIRTFRTPSPFFGISAMIVGVLVALGVGGPLWFQVLLFSVLSVVSLLTPGIRGEKRNRKWS